jgi:HEPN domain-containing protein
MQKVIQEWIDIAQYDLATAEAMLKAKRYLYVVFMCQQAIEKILKAIYVQDKNGLPPRTHNLLYLVDTLKLDMQNKDLTLLSLLNQFYLESRYPGERIQLAGGVDKNKAGQILKRTKEVWKCLKQMLR